VPAITICMTVRVFLTANYTPSLLSFKKVMLSQRVLVTSTRAVIPTRSVTFRSSDPELVQLEAACEY